MLFTLVRSASIAYRGGMSTPSTAITHSRRGILTVLLGALFFSVSAIVIKLAAVEPITTATLRCAIAVPLLALLALREKSSHGALSGRNIWWSIAAGIALGIDYAAWTASIFKVGAGVSTVLLNFQVIVLPLLAWMFDKEPVSRRFKLAAPVMLLGIGMLGGLWGSSELGPEVLTGTALALLAGVGYGIYMFITRRTTRSGSSNIIQQLAWATASAGATTAVVGLFFGGLQFAEITPQAWALLIALAVVGQVIAWLLVHHGSANLSPSTTASLLLAQPVFALIIAAIVLAERPTAIQLLGAGLVVLAVAASHGLLSRRSDA